MSDNFDRVSFCVEELCKKGWHVTADSVRYALKKLHLGVANEERLRRNLYRILDKI